jgi:hypothetical protein
MTFNLRLLVVTYLLSDYYFHILINVSSFDSEPTQFPANQNEEKSFKEKRLAYMPTNFIKRDKVAKERANNTKTY